MKKTLCVLVACSALSLPAKADESCAYRLISFAGMNGAGFASLASVEPGDVLLSVVDAAAPDGTDYVSSFLREIQVQTVAGPVVWIGVYQISGANLSAKKFVALLCRRQPGTR